MSILDPVQNVLDRLQGVRQTGPHQWIARCPAHDDKHASLSIGRGDDGRALIDCKASCPVTDVVKAIGLTMTDLFPPKASATAPHVGDKAALKPCKTQRTFKTLEEAFAEAARLAGGKLVDAWPYPTFRVGRFDLPETDPETGKPKKTFRPVHPVNGGWALGDPPGLLPLYRVEQLPEQGPIFVVEGEGKADVAASFGFAAVTSAHGAKAADKSDWGALAGREVYIMPDNDPAGDCYRNTVGAILTALKPPAIVREIRLPGLPNKGDIVDWVSADGPMGDKDAEEIRAAILHLVQKATPWTPPPVSTPTSTTKHVGTYCPFPVDCLPEPMSSFVAQAAEAMGCDAAFIALPLLAASASAIGNTRRIELKRGWTEPAILWAAIVGDSGTLKSPALECALLALRRRQHEATKQHALEIETHKADVLRYEIDLANWKKSGGQGPPPTEPQTPVLPRCWCDDTTIEALAVLLQQNWRGLLMVRDELAGWLGGFDRYAHGKGGDVAKWLEMHGGRPIMVDRKTGDRKTICVHRAAVSITGGIQPATLRRALGREYFENGLAARLLLAYPPRRVKRWSETEIDAATEESIIQMFDRLYSLEPALGQDGEPEPYIVPLSPEAKLVWVDFFNRHAQEHAELTGDLSAAWSKLEGYAARLALVVHLVRWAAGDSTLASLDVVDEVSMAAGVATSRWFGQETGRVYAIMAESDVDRQHRELVELVDRRGGTVTARDLMRCSRLYPTSEIADQALNGLVQASFGRWEATSPTEKGGRPTRRFVLADTVDVDTTPKVAERIKVSSTEPIEAASQPVPDPATPVQRAVDKTLEQSNECEVLSTSTPSTPAESAGLDPHRPGPVDLLDGEQRRRYLAIYHSRSDGMPPAEKRARAWRAALGGKRE